MYSEDSEDAGLTWDFHGDDNSVMVLWVMTLCSDV